jgi:hypothetical protein
MRLAKAASDRRNQSKKLSRQWRAAIAKVKKLIANRQQRLPKVKKFFANRKRAAITKSKREIGKIKMFFGKSKREIGKSKIFFASGEWQMVKEKERLPKSKCFLPKAKLRLAKEKVRSAISEPRSADKTANGERKTSIRFCVFIRAVCGKSLPANYTNKRRIRVTTKEEKKRSDHKIHRTMTKIDPRAPLLDRRGSREAAGWWKRFTEMIDDK